MRKNTNTAYGVISKTITANSFEELQREVAKYLKKSNNTASTRGNYAAIGGAINKSSRK